MNEEQLLKECLEGIKLSQKAFYEMFARKMMGVLMRYCDTLEDAEDLLQEGFIKVFENLKFYRNEGSLEGWVRRIMVNNAISRFRGKIDFETVELNESHSLKADSSFHTDHALNAQDLLKLIRRLPAGYRTIFNMYAIEGFTHREIGEQLSISEGTSKSQLARAKAILQKQISHTALTI